MLSKQTFRDSSITPRNPRLIKKIAQESFRPPSAITATYFISHLIEFSFRGGEKVRKTWNAEWNYFNPNENAELNFEQKLQ